MSIFAPLVTMSFQLTSEHAHSILDPASAGNWAPFLDALDPEVHWVIGSEEANPEAAIGVYVSLFLCDY